MSKRGKVILAAGLWAPFALAGCVSGPDNAPQWYEQRVAERGGGYPSLHDVPRTSIANTDAGHWGALEAELLAAGEEVRASPRAQPSTGPTPEEFIAEAREDLEQARAAHEP